MLTPLIVTTLAFVLSLICVVLAMLFAFAKRDVTVKITFFELNR